MPGDGFEIFSRLIREDKLVRNEFLDGREGTQGKLKLSGISFFLAHLVLKTELKRKIFESKS